MLKLMIVRGLPGSGKSTFAKKLVKKYGVGHFENDMYFMKNGKYEFDEKKHGLAEDWCYKQVQNCLKSGKNCVVSNVFYRASSVEKYIALAEKCKAKYVIVRVVGDHGNVHSVPDGVLRRFAADFENIENELVVNT